MPKRHVLLGRKGGLMIVAAILLAGMLIPINQAANNYTDGSVLFNDSDEVSEDHDNLFWDNTSKELGIGTSNPLAKLDVRGSATFNEDGGDHDFRIEGTAWSDLFFVDASTNSIGIGTTSPAKELEIESFSPEIAMRSYTTTGLNGFYFYEQAALKSVFQYRCSEASQGNWFVLGGYANDVNVGLLAGGGMSYPDDYRLIVENTGNIIINEGGQDADFRVESTGNANMLFVDANTNRVGIGTNTPLHKLHIHQDSGPSMVRISSNDNMAWITTDAGANMPSGFGMLEVGADKAYVYWEGVNDYLSLWESGNNTLVCKDGKVGIGTTSPSSTLHVNDVMRLEPRSTAPSSPDEGDIYFDSTIGKLMCHDGTTWQACW